MSLFMHSQFHTSHNDSGGLAMVGGMVRRRTVNCESLFGPMAFVEAKAAIVLYSICLAIVSNLC